MKPMMVYMQALNIVTQLLFLATAIVSIEEDLENLYGNPEKLFGTAVMVSMVNLLCVNLVDAEILSLFSVLDPRIAAWPFRLYTFWILIFGVTHTPQMVDLVFVWINYRYVMILTDISNYLIALHCVLSIVYDTAQAIFLIKTVYRYAYSTDQDIKNSRFFSTMIFAVLLALLDWYWLIDLGVQWDYL
jgi:hypothetical protein